MASPVLPSRPCGVGEPLPVCRRGGRPFGGAGPGLAAFGLLPLGPRPAPSPSRQILGSAAFSSAPRFRRIGGPPEARRSAPYLRLPPGRRRHLAMEGVEPLGARRRGSPRPSSDSGSDAEQTDHSSDWTRPSDSDVEFVAYRAGARKRNGTDSPSAGSPPAKQPRRREEEEEEEEEEERPPPELSQLRLEVSQLRVEVAETRQRLDSLNAWAQRVPQCLSEVKGALERVKRQEEALVSHVVGVQNVLRSLNARTQALEEQGPRPALPLRPEPRHPHAWGPAALAAMQPHAALQAFPAGPGPRPQACGGGGFPSTDPHPPLRPADPSA